MLLLVLGVLILGIMLFRGSGQKQKTAEGIDANVTMTNGQQIVQIKVKGGYQPQTSEIKADVPTILRFETNGTFDCTSTIRIPSLGISQHLPPSGITDVALGTLPVGVVQGTCGMGMYRFVLNVNG